MFISMITAWAEKRVKKSREDERTENRQLRMENARLAAENARLLAELTLVKIQKGKNLKYKNSQALFLSVQG